MAKNLSYFMREDARREEIITVPGIDSIRDDKGEVIPFEVKILSQKTIQSITENYKTRKIALDAKKNPYVVGGEIVYETTNDGARAARHILVEALQYPNLRDTELMKFFGCVDLTEMPLLVFSKKNEYEKVIDLVYTALGLRDNGEKSDDIDDAKN